jgi:tRNA dimethylallyltransferase
MVPSTPNPVHSPLTKILILLGPTASGKTSLSLLVGPKINAEIISADSRQIYKYLDIGTAKPTRHQRAQIVHHCVDMLEPDRDYNAGDFGKEGRAAVADIFGRGRVPFVVGGSGLYIRSLIDGFFDGPGADPDIRRQLAERLRLDGAERLLEELRRIDPGSANRMLPTNTRRIIRALEVYQITGIPISELQKEKPDFRFDPVFVGLAWDRSQLYERINRRVDEMLALGLVDEVRSVADRGFSRHLNSLQTTGYAEVFDYFDGMLTEAELSAAIKQNTRRYAKRQMTWFRPDKRIRWFPVGGETDFSALAESIVRYFNETARNTGL